MHKTVIILDLDNTIYPVSSIGNELFKPLFQLIEEKGEYKGEFEKVKKDIMRIPFQKVAADYSFSNDLYDKGLELLEERTCSMDLNFFEDYQELRNISCKKFLVTSGFTKMQQSKIRKLGIENDFEEIFIADHRISRKSKKDIFAEIIKKYNYKLNEVLVVGDDINSEIEAASELGIDALLYDKLNFNPDVTIPPRITNFKQIFDYL